MLNCPKFIPVSHNDCFPILISSDFFIGCYFYVCHNVFLHAVKSPSSKDPQDNNGAPVPQHVLRRRDAHLEGSPTPTVVHGIVHTRSVAAVSNVLTTQQYTTKVCEQL